MNFLDKRFAGFLFFMSLSAVGLANIAFWGLKGSLTVTFISVFTGWTSYLLAHYMAEGVFIDGNEGDQDNKLRPGNLKEVAGTVLGTTILVSGMGLGVYSLNISDLLMTVLAAILFHTGYVITHYSSTGELV